MDTKLYNMYKCIQWRREMNRRRTKKGASDSTEMVDTIGFNMRDIRKNSRSSKYTVKYMVAEINELLPENHKITEGIYYKCIIARKSSYNYYISRIK